MRRYDSGAARALALFDLTNRLVALAGKNEPAIPQTLNDVVVIGMGSAEDCAWVFGELLRQTGIDAVILKPRSGRLESGDQSERGRLADRRLGGGARWLVGALVDGKIYLFDPTLGWPIPAKTDKQTIPTPESRGHAGRSAGRRRPLAQARRLGRQALSAPLGRPQIAPRGNHHLQPLLVAADQSSGEIPVGRSLGDHLCPLGRHGEPPGHLLPGRGGGRFLLEKRGRQSVGLSRPADEPRRSARPARARFGASAGSPFKDR